ncbi:hypothetical protein EE612_044255 [Oryza sativa]|uniref:Uncharacterized protein n=2 Tax=Oryza TaxID=4527 RepID=B8BAR8_ORYSI|nr:hypothetical protein OsI_29223 [Oryza sativa Indica Group]KAB8108494.1 hypothetical protein EE612_044255 [Oryza sativa]
MVGKKVDCISNCRLSSLHLPIPCTSAMNADTEMLEGGCAEKCQCSPQCHRIAPATDASTTSPVSYSPPTVTSPQVQPS